MKQRLGLILAWFGLSAVLAAGAVVERRDGGAGAARGPEPAPGRASTAPAPAPVAVIAPGVAAAHAISEVTGIAISPLLGAGMVGAWRYYHAPAAVRGRLPWFARPWFWAPALFLVGLCFVKDILGPAMTVALKKPLDVIELFENKLSGLVATGAIVPLVWTVFSSLDGGGLLPADVGMGAVSAGAVPGMFLMPLALAAYAVVFLVSHAIHVLILVSPFASVDAALKAFRALILGTVVISATLHPMFGAAWALLIILVCAALAPWAVRLLVFGQVFALDLLMLRHRRHRPAADGNPAFLARPLNGVARRTYGRVFLGAGSRLVFRWRPWWILPEREVRLPEARYQVVRGVVHPSLRSEGMVERDWLWFPPRFRDHEPALSRAFDLEEVGNGGLRAAWSWLRSLITQAVERA